MSGKIQTLIDQRVTITTDARTFLDECETNHDGLTEDEARGASDV